MSVTQGITERPVDATEEALGRWVNVELLPLLKQLRTEVNGIAIPTSLPPSGAAGGQLGGTYPNPDVRGVRETAGPTLLTLGAVADGEFLKRSAATVIGGTPPSSAGLGSTEGSIFSMVGPGGAANPIVAYDFTRFDGTLTLAQNLLAANQSGNSSFDLEAVLTPEYKPTAERTGSVAAFQPFAVNTGGAALFTVAANGFAQTISHPAALQLQSAMTMEWLGYLPVGPGAGSVSFIRYGDSGSAVQNVQYQMFWDDPSNNWLYYHESGVSFGSTVNLLTTSNADMIQTSPFMVTITRAATTGTLTLYVNGRHAVTSTSTAGVLFPTGGGSGKLAIGPSFGGGHSANMGVRIFDVELTAAQAQASYRRTFFGVSA